jgi:hypothetical protein
MRRECEEGIARLGSARLGSARLGSARLGSARLGREGGSTTSFVSVSSWLMVGLFLIRRAFDAYLSVLTVSSCHVLYRSLVCVVHGRPVSVRRLGSTQ